jgi:hypothetical protein
MKFVPSILTKVKPNFEPVFGVTFVTVGPTDIAEETVIDRLAVAVSAGELESVAVTVKLEVPAVVGVPVIAPVVLLRLSPAGSFPLVTTQV